MRPVSARWIADVTGGVLAADPSIEVTAVSQDSRQCRPGSLYVAFPGANSDGHDFVESATGAGAALHMVTRAVDAPHVLVVDATVALGQLARAYLAELRSDSDLAVIAVTGSVGKTTTKDLLAQMLPACIAPRGSFNNAIGLPLTVFRADDTTRNLVLEMGANGAGHIAYLASIAPPDIAVILAVGHAHLGEFGSIEGVARAKAELIEGCAPGATVVLNADDPRVAQMAALSESVTTFGLGDADVRAIDVTMQRGRASFTLVAEGIDAPVSLRLVGEHHVTNALAAGTVALALGMHVPEVADLLSGATANSPHRMALVERPDGVTVLDDSYNASPESMRAAFRALRDIAESGRSFAVIGEMLEMGDGSLAAHDELGHLAVRLGIDHLVVVGEGARAAYDAAVREGSFGDEAVFVATMEDARAYLQANLAPGDTVLVKASHGSGLWRLADDLTGGSA
jgi:UDP-N-acetylmuramoyl-tripeptide--D-alanyl-D-alanine ligase